MGVPVNLTMSRSIQLSAASAKRHFQPNELLAGLDAFVAGLTEFEILQFNPSEVRRIDKRIQPQACQ